MNKLDQRGSTCRVPNHLIAKTMKTTTVLLGRVGHATHQQEAKLGNCYKEGFVMERLAALKRAMLARARVLQ